MKQHICFLMLGALFPVQLQAVTAVYNMRIAEATRRQVIEEVEPSVVGALLFDQWRLRRDGAHQNIVGGLASYSYNLDPWYIRLNGALARVKSVRDGVIFKRTQLDDFLIYGGYGHAVNERVRCAVSGLFGIPTHEDTNLQGVQFGTGHVGLGAQVDGSFIYSHDKKHSLLTAARYVHFFPRNAKAVINNQCRTFDVHLGNAIDLLLIQRSAWNHNAVEVGYNAGIVFGVEIFPRIDALGSSSHGVRSSFFGNYRRGFAVGSHASAVAVGLSYSFDHGSFPLTFKQIVSAFVAWGINF